MKAKIVALFAGMLFMIVFGVIDNAFLVLGMDVNPFITPEADPMLSAMWGNTISDVIGAIAGMMVSWSFLKVFNVKPKEHILIEIVGVLIGCLIPIGIYVML